MGGGGGSIHWPNDTDSRQILGKAVGEDEKSAYQVDVNTYLQDLLLDFNNRNVDQINTHLATIKQAIEKDIAGTVDLIQGGSVSKHTYVDGLSDIDMLVIINSSSLANANPTEVLEYFASRLRERFPNSEVNVGNLAVTVKFTSTEHEFQILPAISTPTGLKISKADGSGWSSVIKPDEFARKLTSVNQRISHKVVPVIKLFKAINSQLHKDEQLTGYHIESLAINAFKDYSGPLNYKDMLLHLSKHSSINVLNPIRDSTGQSIHIDDYLGESGSIERQRTSAALGRVAARMRLADSEASIERWKALIGE